MSTDPSIKFQPRKDEGNYKAVNQPDANRAPPSKPFKNLMDKSGDMSGETGDSNLLRKAMLDDSEDVTIAEEAQAALGSPVPSLFDLQKTTTTTVAKEDPPMPATPPPAQRLRTPGDEVVEQSAESPASLFKRMSGKDSSRGESKAKSISEFEKTGAKKEKMASPFRLEQPTDLSYANPLNAVANPIESLSESKVDTPIPSPTNKTVQEIIDKIVDKVQEQSTNGITETTISLKNHSLFEGASVVITAYDTARGQYNITFQNLTTQAKYILDMQANQDSLKHALEVKGYAVHILIATTEIEKPIATAESRHDQRDSKGQGEGQQQQQRGRQKQNRG